jgi:hypothetical protein
MIGHLASGYFSATCLCQGGLQHPGEYAGALDQKKGDPLNIKRPVSVLVSSFLLFLTISCGGQQMAGSTPNWAYPLQKVYNADQDKVWYAVLQTLPQMGFIIQLMDRDLGLIRASDDIRRDLYSLLSGTTYWMEVRIREIGPQTTIISIDYPQIRSLLHERVSFDPDANIFDYIQDYMGKR